MFQDFFCDNWPWWYNYKECIEIFKLSFLSYQLSIIILTVFYFIFLTKDLIGIYQSGLDNQVSKHCGKCWREEGVKKIPWEYSINVTEFE